MKTEELLKRIEALEAEVARLKLMPPQQIHYHYGYYPVYPQPTLPCNPLFPTVIYGNNAAQAA